MNKRLQMKTYKNLWENLISDQNICIAIKDYARGRKDRPKVLFMSEHPEQFCEYYRTLAENYIPPKHTPVKIKDGIRQKEREIIVPKMDEQIIHHMIVNVFKPIVMKSLYEYTYGSVPNRGIKSAKEVIQKWIQTDKKNVKYCLKLDIHHYFQSVDHTILKQKLSQKISDNKFLGLCDKIINSETGIPLGFYTSQWFSIFYLNELDHKIKQGMYAPHYIRYVDDLVIFGANKRKLHKTWISISNYLEHIGLSLNNKCQLFRFDYITHGTHKGRFLDFLGCKFYRDRITMRKSIFHKMITKAKRLSKKQEPTFYESRQMLTYIGWIKMLDIHNSCVKYIYSRISMKQLRMIVSEYDKRKGLKSCHSSFTKYLN